jgi:hypothetical protein
VRSKYKQNWINHLERMDNNRLPKHPQLQTSREKRSWTERWQRVDAGTGQTTYPWRKMMMMMMMMIPEDGDNPETCLS